MRSPRTDTAEPATRGDKAKKTAPKKAPQMRAEPRPPFPTEEEFDTTFKTNMYAYYRLAKEALPTPIRPSSPASFCRSWTARPPVDNAALSTRLHVNGTAHSLPLEARRSLLDVLREDLGLTGAKKVCDMGNCGACTVLVAGRAVYSCLVLAIDCAEAEIVTIEGIGAPGALDPVQQAFIDADAFQCGFCTPGQIMSVKALLQNNPNPSDADIQHALNGNLCRCGAYRNILRAARIAAGREPDAAIAEGRIDGSS